MPNCCWLIRLSLGQSGNMFTPLYVYMCVVHATCSINATNSLQYWPPANTRWYFQFLQFCMSKTLLNFVANCIEIVLWHSIKFMPQIGVICVLRVNCLLNLSFSDILKCMFVDICVRAVVCDRMVEFCMFKNFQHIDEMNTNDMIAAPICYTTNATTSHVAYNSTLP